MPRTRRSSGEDMNPTQRLMFAASQNNIDMCMKIFNDQMNKDVNLVNAIDIDELRQQNALLIAARSGSLEVLKWLITLSVDLEIKTISGASSLYLTCQEGFIECLMALKVAGANVDTTIYNGDFPLRVASYFNHCSIISYLLKIGCDVNQSNLLNGKTSLISAAENNKPDAIKVLLSDPEININAYDKIGWNALSIAKAKNHTECVNLLKDAIDTGPPKFHIDKIFSEEKLANEVQDVDEMKIQTMYKMVDECTVVTQGKEVQKKVLYLTNKQAVMFDEEAMERAVLALDIGEPKFVIKLMGSLGMQSQMLKSHPEKLNTSQLLYKKSTSITSEMDMGDERHVETQIILFMKTCILPLAMQTRALILVNGANDCILSSALARVAVAEQARLGKDCPFTVIATVSENEIHAKAVSPNPGDLTSIASQLARQSPAWQKRIVFMNDFYSGQMLLDNIPLQQCIIITVSLSLFLF